MSPGAEGRPPLPDAAARERILSDLETNLLVEAGAGSGKTTALVGRMVALVRDGGVEVERIAAVTFTRKAAGELRERFQEALETALGEAPRGSEAAERLDGALRSLDRAFMGTIHAFCARLLRERPLEAGLDPAFQELTAQEAVLLARRWWNVWLERLGADGDPVLDELDAVGIRPAALQHAFQLLGEYSDVDVPLPPEPRPDAEEIAAVRRETEDLMARADAIFPGEEPEGGWDRVQEGLRTAWFLRRTFDWEDDRIFLEALSRLHGAAGGFTLNRWPGDGPVTPRELRAAFQDWAAEGSRATRLLRRWMAHRYPVAAGFALRAAREFAEYRKRTGRLTFHDLLALAADLLRRSPAARRDLGERVACLLVDEFQDTDPLQAEVLFLLASDPEEDPGEDGGRPPPPADWRRCTPRPGALFVVGDPKQSIYRFRRADIALYQRVRGRFDGEAGGFGAVLRLTANFRSRPPIAAVVNDTFDAASHFPAEATERQAAFAPLEPQRDDVPPAEGGFVHAIPTASGRGRQTAERESESRALANWIAERVERGERAPGDFLLLTRTKRALDLYARALEARNLPVEVSGAGVGIEEEMSELRTVLRALTDPDDPVATVAALTGLFFGLDLDQLLRHREAGRSFDLRRAPPGAEAGDEPVEAALATLHRWWRRAREQPADVVLLELVEELGLLPWAASGELGGVRAGALAFALDAVRAAGLDGDTSIPGALDALEAALGEEEVEAPLEPGRAEAVRLMNLHKAKGLEGRVVILADPFPVRSYAPELVVERPAPGEESATPTAWLRVGEPGSFGHLDELARPLTWETVAAEEEAFQRAEEVRLLYVAATRARDELVVSRRARDRDAAGSPWADFHPWLAEHGIPLELDDAPPPPRDRLDVSGSEMRDRMEAVRREREGRGVPAWAFETVTTRVKGRDGPSPEADDGTGSGGTEKEPTTGPDAVPVEETRLGYALAEADSTGPGGFEWGSAVHAVLEAAARGVDPDGLRAAARTALLENDRPQEDGEPTELDTLLELVDAVRGSDLWRRARDAERTLAEHPFVVEYEDGHYLEGVIDLAFREVDESGGAAWVVVDYKTDRGIDPDFEARRARYREQVDAYARAWERLTGEPVKEARVWMLRGEEA